MTVRKRPELQCSRQWFGRERFWILKDPVTLSYFQLTEEEFAIWEMLDGGASLEDIQSEFEKRFAPQTLDIEQLRLFVRSLHGEGLVISEAAGQGHELLARRIKRSRRSRWALWTNPLAIRFPGFNAGPLLDRLEPIGRVLISFPTLAAGLFVIAIALLLVFTHWAEIPSRLPTFDEFIRPQNVLYFAAAIAIVKVLHEFAHALACRRMGAECHEIGLMLLVFTPCLYCNVSDAWRLPDRARRLLITAAGIGVELVLAALCTIGWWFSQPGTFHDICLNVMVLGSVNTLLLNGNPLLRYDGYYLLADAVEVPNLASQSRAVVRRAMANWCLGLELFDDPSIPRDRRWFLAVYAVLSMTYRLIIVAVILWGFYVIFDQFRLGLMAFALAAVVLTGWLTPPMSAAARFLNDPESRRQVRHGRPAVVLVLILGLGVLFFTVPLPYAITAPVVVQPADAQYVYVAVPGRLESTLEIGSAVSAGEEIVRLHNADIELELARLRAERNRLQTMLEMLIDRQGIDPTAAARIPTVKKTLSSIEQQLSQLEEDAAQLSVTAPVDGTLLPPPVSATTPPPHDQLATFAEPPLQPSNIGCYFETGTPLGAIGDPESFEVVMIVDQADVEFLKPGQSVQLDLDMVAIDLPEGTVAEIARMDVEVDPREQGVMDELLTARSLGGDPQRTAYRVRVALDRPHPPLRLWTQGRARVKAAPQPWGRRLLRWTRRTFTFEL